MSCFIVSHYESFLSGELYKCMQKTIVSVGFGTVCSIRYPRGSWHESLQKREDLGATVT